MGFVSYFPPFLTTSTAYSENLSSSDGFALGGAGFPFDNEIALLIYAPLTSPASSTIFTGVNAIPSFL